MEDVLLMYFEQIFIFVQYSNNVYMNYVCPALYFFNCSSCVDKINFVYTALHSSKSTVCSLNDQPQKAFSIEIWFDQSQI